MNHISIIPVSEQTKIKALHQTLKFGEIQQVVSEDNLHVYVGGQKKGMTAEDVRYLGGVTRKAVQSSGCDQASFDMAAFIEIGAGLAEESLVVAWLEGWYLAGYQFTMYQKQEKQTAVMLLLDEKYESYRQTARIRANAVNTARDLCNEPANKLTPAVYAERIQEIFHRSKVQVKIIETEELQEAGFEAIATVGKGSSNPPKLAVLTLKTADQKHVALVGKGVTFDSGGTNVKAGGDISEMKMDMGGSAAVVGAMKLLADLELPVHVTAIIPLVTNVAGGNAYLPSDVIRYANGLHVEVGNTDAEGRLVLADGILHAQELGAETIIDIATLTGTIGQALGLKVAGIYCNQEKALWGYKELGEKTGDYVWPMPLVQDYQTYLKSDTADINNMSANKFGGSITAALFLENFVSGDKKWVHIDMANTVRPWQINGYYVPGASGFGVRLLTEMVMKEVR